MDHHITSTNLSRRHCNYALRGILFVFQCISTPPSSTGASPYLATSFLSASKSPVRFEEYIVGYHYIALCASRSTCSVFSPLRRRIHLCFMEYSWLPLHRLCALRGVHFHLLEHLVIPVQRLSRSSFVPRGIHFRHALPCLPVHIYASPGFHHAV